MRATAALSFVLVAVATACSSGPRTATPLKTTTTAVASRPEITAVATTAATATAVSEAPPTTLHCGAERWAVKTGQDLATNQIDLTNVHPATIAELTAIPPPHAPSARTPPVETTVYQVQGTVAAYKLESDSDDHVVIADDHGRTMITEIPAPACMGSSPLKAQVQGARAAFDTRFHPEASLRQANVPVTVTGVGFFDFNHGQVGVAPNAIELHPVLSVTFG